MTFYVKFSSWHALFNFLSPTQELERRRGHTLAIRDDKEYGTQSQYEKQEELVGTFTSI